MATIINGRQPAERLREAFSSQLIAKRREFGITQMELAERTQLSQGSLSRFERGTREPSLSQLAVIANALGVAPSELLSE